MFWIIGLSLFAAAAVTFIAPRVLSIGEWQLFYPRIALTAWFGSFFCGLLLILGGIIASVAGAIMASENFSQREGFFITIAGWLGLGVFGATLAFVLVSAEPVVELGKQRTESLTPVAFSRENHSKFTLVRFNSDNPRVWAVPGKNPEIFLSSEAENRLTTGQLQAVIAHEYAHIRHRHEWALTVAHIHSMCLAGRKPARLMQRATHLLIELAADDAAARQAGAANLANALSILADATQDESMLLRADRLTHRKWPRAARRRLPWAPGEIVHT